MKLVCVPAAEEPALPGKQHSRQRASMRSGLLKQLPVHCVGLLQRPAGLHLPLSALAKRDRHHHQPAGLC